LKRRFATYKEARAWLAATRSHVGAGSFVRPQKVTVEQWVTDWLPVLQTQVGPQMYDSYARNLRLHLLPTLGARPLQSLKPADLSTLYARLLKSGRADHAAGTGRKHEQMRTWSQQELGRFLDVTRGHPHHPAWLLLATTGLRRGEALGLAWSSVDLDSGRTGRAPGSGVTRRVVLCE